MKVKLVSEGLRDLTPMEDRSNGVHISGVIYALCVARGIYKPGEALSEEEKTRMNLGNALESAIIAKYQQADKRRYIQVGEQECDDLFGTPDMMDIIEWAVHEMKLTWMSSKHHIESVKLWKYLVQVKAYCYMLKTLIGYLHVCYVNGDYSYRSPGGDPTYKVYRFEFTKQELEENWAMLKNHMHMAKAEDHSVPKPVAKKRGKVKK